MRHIHLDPVGGIAGDMFLAAVLHAWPELEDEIVSAMRCAGLPDDWSVAVSSGTSAGIAGRRIAVQGDAGDKARMTGSFAAIRRRLEAADLRPAVRARAIDIFHRLAKA